MKPPLEDLTKRLRPRYDQADWLLDPFLGGLMDGEGDRVSWIWNRNRNDCVNGKV